MPSPRFPPPWTVEDPDPTLDRQCFIVRDANGQALAYVYCEDEPGRSAAAKLLTRDEARRIVNIATLGEGGVFSMPMTKRSENSCRQPMPWPQSVRSRLWTRPNR